MNLDNLTKSELAELHELLEQEELEKISPKMELFRQPYRIKIAHGGRGAGAKSWSAASPLIQRANFRPTRICCFCEVQRSLEESSCRLMSDTITRLHVEWAGSNALNKQIQYDIARKGIAGVSIKNCFKGTIIDRIDLCQLLPGVCRALPAMISTLRRRG